MKNKNGFTIVELIAVIIIFIVITLISIFVVNRVTESSKIKALLSDANTFAKGAMSKEETSEDEDLVRDDAFHNTVDGKVCFSITDKILSKYVNDNDKKYRGSVELCYGDECTYTTKVWLTDGKYYIDGLTNPNDDSQVKQSFTTDYPETCGVRAIGGGTGGSLTTADFDFIGKEQVFNVLIDGVYSLETWGAQGGDINNHQYIGGFGGYSYVEVDLKKGDKLYINVGQQGSDNCPTQDDCYAAYNGGARGGKNVAGGGGATSIASKSGELLKVPIQYVYIISGGGSGAAANSYDGARNGGAAGGYATTNSPTGSWTTTIVGGAFYGGIPATQSNYRGDGGGYGAGAASGISYATTLSRNANLHPIGGTGYVFNKYTKNGVMYCHANGCTLNGASFDTAKTIINSDYSKEATAQASKAGNGYARITYLRDLN